jgi:hypothetical protein
VCKNFEKGAGLKVLTGSLKEHESKAERTPNSNFQEFVPDRVEHMELDCAAHTKKTATKQQQQCRKSKSILSQKTEQAKLALRFGCLVSWM